METNDGLCPPIDMAAVATELEEKALKRLRNAALKSPVCNTRLAGHARRWLAARQDRVMVGEVGRAIRDGHY